MALIYDRDIAKEWYEYGEKIKDDFFVKFMAYWIAFNWKYSADSGGTEREQISHYCSLEMSNLVRYDAFSEDACKIFFEGPIYNEKFGHFERGLYNKVKTKKSIH